MSEIQSSIEERIKPIIAEQFCRDANEIDLSANLAESYDCDSLDVVEIAMCVEDEFGIEIPDEPMWEMKTGQQIVDYVTANVKA